jgi:hypothetical protein
MPAPSPCPSPPKNRGEELTSFRHSDQGERRPILRMRVSFPGFRHRPLESQSLVAVLEVLTVEPDHKLLRRLVIHAPEADQQGTRPGGQESPGKADHPLAGELTHPRLACAEGDKIRVQTELIDDGSCLEQPWIGEIERSREERWAIPRADGKPGWPGQNGSRGRRERHATRRRAGKHRRLRRRSRPGGRWTRGRRRRTRKDRRHGRRGSHDTWRGSGKHRWP